MSAQRPRPISDDRLREALDRSPDAQLIADDLAAIVAIAGQTRQSRALPTRWLTLAAALLLLVLLAVAAAAVLSRPQRDDIGVVALDVDRHIVVANGDGTGLRQLTSGAESDWEPVLSPDGTRLVYWSSDPIAPSDTCGIFCLGVPRRLMMVELRRSGAAAPSLVTTVSPGASWRMSWAPDGRRLAIGDQMNDVRVIVLVDVDAKTRTVIGPSDLDGWDPAWSPDGHTIAFVRGHVDLAIRGLYAMDADGTNLRRLTSISSRGAGFLEPVWSPAGDRLAFAAETNGTDPFQKDIWTVGLDGAPEVDISNDSTDEDVPSWSPDGTRLAYVRKIASETNAFHVVVSGVDGTQPTILSPVVGHGSGAWSPGATKVVVFEPGATPATDRMVAIDVHTGSVVVIAVGHPDGVGSWGRSAP
jgi:Tol biopolymer transport system component